MKNLYPVLLLLFTLISITATSQSPNWQWAESIDAHISQGSGICTDAAGNVYVVGNFNGNSVVLSNTTLLNPSASYNMSVFIAKYNNSGNLVWAKSAGVIDEGENNSAQGTGIKTDVNGNVFVIGNFVAHKMVLGNDTLTVTGVAEQAFFIAKYDSSGNEVWAKDCSSGNVSDNDASAIAISSTYDILVTGTYSDTVVFGSYTFINDNTPYTPFIVNYDESGNVVWAKSGQGSAGPTAVSTGINGMIYISGNFTGPAVILGNDTLLNTAANDNDIFVAKYNSSGNLIWAKCANNTYSVVTWGMSADMNGNVLLTGNMESPAVTFDSFTLTNTSANFNFFIVNYDSSGNVVWAKASSALNSAMTDGIVTDANGNSYLIGDFLDPLLILGNDTLINTDATGAVAEVFIAKYDNSGNTVWAKGCVGDSSNVNNVGTGINIDVNDNIYVTGYYETSHLSFDNIDITKTGIQNGFIAKLGKGTTGITTETNTVENIKIFPNPSTGTFYFTGLPAGAAVAVYNVLGEIISSSIADNSDYGLNLNSEAKGIYFYRVTESGNVVGMGKMVVE